MVLGIQSDKIMINFCVPVVRLVIQETVFKSLKTEMIWVFAEYWVYQYVIVGGLSWSYPFLIWSLVYNWHKKRVFKRGNFSLVFLSKKMEFKVETFHLRLYRNIRNIFHSLFFLPSFKHCSFLMTLSAPVLGLWINESRKASDRMCDRVWIWPIDLLEIGWFLIDVLV